MKIICFSDVHLLLHDSEEEKSKLKILNSFFDFIEKEKPDKLIIAGDLFDVWYEYKLVIPKPYFHILCRLSSIEKLGIKIIYLVGNHDFKFKNFFDKYIHAQIFYDDYQLNLNNEKYFFSHGDEYTSNDMRYHILKSILRNKLVNKVFGLFHPDIGLKFGRWMSRSSKNKQDPPDKLKKLEKGMIDFAKMKIHQGYNYIIMGHIHNPKIIELKKGKYINLGDWIVHHSYLIIDKKGPQLKYWRDKITDK